MAHIAADHDTQRAGLAAVDIQRERERAQHDADRDAAVDADYRAVRTHVRAVLVAAGWYSHKRQWLRMNLEHDDMDELQRVDLERITEADVNALIERCNKAKPKAADLDALRRVLESPIGKHLQAFSGLTLASQIVDTTPGAQMVLKAEMERHRQQLGGDDAPPLEQPLLSHIVTCWVSLQLTQREHTSATRGQHNMREALYWDRRLAAAQARYLRALGLLARMRALTSVQINVATNQQVNNG